jgi:hypothetical protein
MKSFLSIVFTLCAITVMAVQAPFQKWVPDILTQHIMDLPATYMVLGSTVGKAVPVAVTGDISISDTGVVSMASINADGLNQKRVARATYDVAVDLGTVAAHGLGVNLPAKAVITRSWFYTVTQFTDAGSGTVALHCEDANNIYSAADITGIAAGTVTDGVQDGTTANFTGSIAASCEITATVAGSAQTAGKLILFVEYIVVE